MYIHEGNRKAAAEFVSGPLWAEFKRCLGQRAPLKPDVTDPSHVAAAKGHQKTGYDKAIEEIEKIPFEFEEKGADPMQRPAVTITED